MAQAKATAAKPFQVTCANGQLPWLAFEFADSELGSGPAIDRGHETLLNLPRFLFGPHQMNGQELSILKCPLKLQSCSLRLHAAGT